MLTTFTALADSNRLRIVELLRAGPRPVSAIGAALAMNQPQVSKHLRVLKEARLVAVEPRAQQRVYGLAPEPLRELAHWLEDYRDIWDERLDRLDELVGELQRRPAKARIRTKQRPERTKP